MKNNFLVHIFQKIVRSLTVNYNEPHIEQKKDRYGNLYWKVFDCRTKKLYTFGSTSEVRAWIEQRHYTI